MPWNDRRRRIIDGLQMLWKRLLSYRKREWDLADYPVVIREQTDVPPANRYSARILGWGIVGLGVIQEDALREMEHCYETRKAALKESGKPVPRPGTEVPLEFASQERVSAREDLMNDFIHRILDLPWAFLSDESSLWHFHGDENNNALSARIKEVYGVDVSDISSGNLAEILERIAMQRVR
jgi:hypothetical protein